VVYKFNGEIFRTGQRVFISIPFNVWEECGVKGNVPVKVIIDELTYECKLIPKGNGVYYIPVMKDNLRKINVDKKLEVSFEVISQLSRINNNSPYSLEKPVRKIDDINIVKTKNGQCGQACVAMLSGVAFDEIIKLMGSQVSMSKVIEALDYFGIGHSQKMVYSLNDNNKLPKCCIVNTKGHLMVFYDEKYYDPSVGILEQIHLSEITGFLEIFI